MEPIYLQKCSMYSIYLLPSWERVSKARLPWLMSSYIGQEYESCEFIIIFSLLPILAMMLLLLPLGFLSLILHRPSMHTLPQWFYKKSRSNIFFFIFLSFQSYLLTYDSVDYEGVDDQGHYILLSIILGTQNSRVGLGPWVELLYWRKSSFSPGN